MSDDLITALRSLDPAPAARTDGAARSAWGEATLRRIATTPAVAPRRPRWRVAAVAATGALALVALFLVLVTATGGSDDTDTPAAGGETIVLTPYGRRPADPDALEAGIVRRIEALGVSGFRVDRRGDATLITQAVPNEGELDAVIQPGFLNLVPRANPVDRFQLDVAEARVSEGTVTVALTEASAAEFTAATRRWVQEAALDRRERVGLSFSLGKRVLAQPTLDVSDYPRGLDGSSGIQFESRDADVVAAILSTPFPPGSWTLRFPDGYDSGVTSPVS